MESHTDMVMDVGKFQVGVAPDWKPLEQSTIKVNVGGSINLINKLVACGGVIRNE